MTRSKLIPLILALGVLAPAGSAAAAIKNPTADAAIKKGVRDFVRYETDGGTWSKIDITCKPVKKVNQKGACVGSFRVTVDGKTVTYTLTKKARTFRISPGAIEYRLSAKADHKIKGAPSVTDLAGFLQ